MKIGNFSIWLSPSRLCPASLDCEDLGDALVAQLGQAHRVEQLADRRLQLLHGPLEITPLLLRTAPVQTADDADRSLEDRKSTRLNSSHVSISYAVFCLKKKN